MQIRHLEKQQVWELKRKQPTKAIVTALLKDGRAHVTGLYSEKTGKTYDAPWFWRTMGSTPISSWRLTGRKAANDEALPL